MSINARQEATSWIVQRSMLSKSEGKALTVMTAQSVWWSNALMLLSGQRKIILERVPAIYDFFFLLKYSNFLLEPSKIFLYQISHRAAPISVQRIFLGGNRQRNSSCTKAGFHTNRINIGITVYNTAAMTNTTSTIF